MRLEKMLLNNVISVRAYNVCKRSNLSSASEILDYYKEKGTFRDLNHCGSKSNTELTEFCEELEEAENTKLSKPVICNLDFIEGIDESDVEVIDRYIVNETKSLSQRSYNALIRHLQSNTVDLQSLCEHVFGNQNFQVLNMHNIGKGTIDELTSYLDSIENFIHSVQKQKVH